MLVEELRLRKGSLAAAGHLMLTEQEVSGWHHLLYIWTDSGERCQVDSQVQWPGVPARILVLQSFVGRLPSWLPDEPRKEGILKKKRKKEEYALLECICLWSWHLSLWGVNHPQF